MRLAPAHPLSLQERVCKIGAPLIGFPCDMHICPRSAVYNMAKIAMRYRHSGTFDSRDRKRPSGVNGERYGSHRTSTVRIPKASTPLQIMVRMAVISGGRVSRQNSDKSRNANSNGVCVMEQKTHTPAIITGSHLWPGYLPFCAIFNCGKGAEDRRFSNCSSALDLCPPHSRPLQGLLGVHVSI